MLPNYIYTFRFIWFIITYIEKIFHWWWNNDNTLVVSSDDANAKVNFSVSHTIHIKRKVMISFLFNPCSILDHDVCSKSAWIHNSHKLSENSFSLICYLNYITAKSNIDSYNMVQKVFTALTLILLSSLYSLISLHLYYYHTLAFMNSSEYNI